MKGSRMMDMMMILQRERLLDSTQELLKPSWTTFEIGSGNGETYTAPKRKMPQRASFCGRGSRRSAIYGIGSAINAISVQILGIALPHQNLLSSIVQRNSDAGIGWTGWKRSQKACVGRH